MGGKLIIVESPAKARTLQRYLGNGYQVMSSQGHVRDLPEKKLGVDVNKGFRPIFVQIASKKQVIRKLKERASGSEEIILATDPDREGEAIAWHLQEILRTKVWRIEFHEVTRDKVLEALSRPREINQLRVESQLARRILDRLVGYGLSPVLWKKVKRGLSAGRVQSVAVRMVCEREEEVKSFTAQEYWLIVGNFESSNSSFSAELVEFGGKKILRPSAQKSDNGMVVSSKDDALRIESTLHKLKYSVSKVEDKEVRRVPPPPFITASLQQEAFRKLGFASSRTMRIAQGLYEGVDMNGERMGLITYMRTDSVRVSDEFAAKARDYIGKNYGTRYLPLTTRSYRSRPSAQEAHEAIRPTDLNISPQSIKGRIGEDSWKLYDLIYRRFLASQMADAVFNQRTITVEGGKGDETAVFRRSYRSMLFDGFTRVLESAEKAEGDADEGDLENEKNFDIVMSVVAGTLAKLISVKTEQHFTKPPPRYTEATLIKALEEHGIGRPSTYAPIIDTIIRRGYVAREQRSLRPTEWAFVTNKLLEDYFPEIVDVKFTARVEEGLDEVEEGKEEWKKLVGEIYFPLEEKIEKALKDKVRYKAEPETLSELCPECGASLVLRYGRYGKFVACSNFPVCRYVKKNNEVQEIDEKCPDCGAPLVALRNRWGVQFVSCSTYPHCKYVAEAQRKCPKCGSKLLKRRAKNRRVFYVCEKNTKDQTTSCDFVLFGHPTIEKCPLCGYFLAERRKGGKLDKFCANTQCQNHKGIEEDSPLAKSSIGVAC